MTNFAFEARDISMSFGAVQALKNVSLGIAKGEVHAIIGENGAGKSTLMNIFCGKLHPTHGELARNGARVNFHSPIDAQQAGIGIAPQEVSLVPNLTVYENILLGAQRSRGGWIDWKATQAAAVDHLHSVDDTIDPDVPVSTLSKAQQQLVQIARAAATEATILIFDEPTAALTYRETEKLNAYIHNFRDEGGSVFYISHRLDEVLELSDRISVLRDGAFIAELDPRTTTKEEMVNHMVGRVVSRAERAPRPGVANAEVVLKVTGLSRDHEFEDVSFDLRKGEILGGIEYPLHPSLVHHHDAVAHVDDLFDLGADEDDRKSVFRQSAQLALNFKLGVHVDAARRLVHDENLRIPHQPATDDDLLLVAAR